MGNQRINPPLWLFVIGLSQIIPVYLAARASLPDTVEEKGVSLAAHYAEVSRYFWAAVAFTYLMFVAYGITIEGPGAILGTLLSPAAQLLMMSTLIVLPSRRVHTVLVPVIFLLFCYDHLLSPMFA